MSARDLAGDVAEGAGQLAGALAGFTLAMVIFKFIVRPLLTWATR